MIIKRLTLKDYNEFKRIRLECLHNNPQAFGSKYHDEILYDNNHWIERLGGSSPIYFGIEQGSKLIAISGVREQNHQHYVISVYVSPESRGQRLTMQLLSHLFNIFFSEQYNSHILLKVESQNISAIHVYKNLGFKIIKLLPDQLMGDGNFHQEYLMQLNKADWVKNA